MQIQWNPRPFKRDWEVDEWVLAQKQTLADPESFSSFISTNQDQHETSLLILKSPHKKIEVNDFSLLLKQWVDFKTVSPCGCNNPFGMRSGQTTYHNTRETDGRTKTPEIVITKWGKKMRNTPLKVYAECSNVFIYTFLLLCHHQGKTSILIDVSYFYCG